LSPQMISSGDYHFVATLPICYCVESS
jgi:hypothetical protein